MNLGMNLQQKYSEIRSYTEALCSPLRNEDYVAQPAFFASPPKWHLAHLSWFFEEFILKIYTPNYQLYNPQFNYLFNSYYNNVGDRIQRDNRGSIIRPTVEEVYEYRKHVDQKMNSLISSVKSQEFVDLVLLGLNHEQQHQELLITDLKNTWGHSPTFPVYKEGFDIVNTPVGKVDYLTMDEGLYSIGNDQKSFCFDNELGCHNVYLEKYSISDGLITNKEYQEFIEDAGYENFNLWLDDGWTWVNENRIKAPLYWIQNNERWMNYTLGGLIPIRPDSPVCHISFYEAWAFAQWKGRRLPTEFEWEAASDKFDWGTRWEWTNSAYLPYPRFEKAPGAIGEYNGKFMINKMVLRGASVATSKGHSRKSYRNFFHPSERWQFTGIRLIKNE